MATILWSYDGAARPPSAETLDLQRFGDWGDNVGVSARFLLTAKERMQATGQSRTAETLGVVVRAVVVPRSSVRPKRRISSGAG
jgi:hypothetical protein